MILLLAYIFRALKRTSLFWMTLSLLLCMSRQDVPAQTKAPSEYELKAVFLFNFAQFVDWPAASFADSETPLTIGILGDDPFGTYLDETVKDEKVNGRSLLIKRYSTLEEVQGCHVLFISGSESKQVKQIVAGLKERSILTVGDTEGYAKNGVMIRLFKDDKKIKLKINVEAAKAANLTISSKLLRLAEIVEPGKD